MSQSHKKTFYYTQTCKPLTCLAILVKQIKRLQRHKILSKTPEVIKPESSLFLQVHFLYKNTLHQGTLFQKFLQFKIYLTVWLQLLLVKFPKETG